VIVGVIVAGTGVKVDEGLGVCKDDTGSITAGKVKTHEMSKVIIRMRLK
jgi:hypothetical protein